MRAPAELGAALLAIVLAAPGCRRQAPAAPPPPQPLLGAVQVRDLTPPDQVPARLDTAALEGALRQRLSATGLFAATAPDGGARSVVRARVEIALESAEVGDKGAARARVRLRLDTRPSDAAGAIDEELDGAGEQIYAVGRQGARGAAAPARPGSQALYQTLVLRVAGDLIGGLAARRQLQGAAPEAVHAALARDGGELREEAIRVAGQRKLAQEVPVLLQLLNDPDESIRDAALGALIQIGDRRAVSELTRTRSLRDRREMRKIIEAIGILGGQEALDYLAFVAQSHDDDDIRAEAAAARARLERRMADGGNRL
jgi:HEAT repeat protein